MARNACVRSRRGSGDWIGHTDIWNDPRAQLQESSPVEPALKPASINSITEKQMSYLKSLIDSCIISSNEETTVIAKGVKLTANSLWKEGGLTKSIASQLIASLCAVR